MHITIFNYKSFGIFIYKLKQQSMSRGKRKQLSLPPIKQNLIQNDKNIACHNKVVPDSAIRSKTQPFTNKYRRVAFSSSQLPQNVSEVQQIQQSAVYHNDRKDSLQKNKKGGSICQIIDTRKSIKILLEYFDSKNQEQKNKNMNCYHSPNKQVQQLLPMINTPERSVVGRKAINLKKIKLQQKKIQAKTSGKQSPVKLKKYRSYLMKDIMKIQTLPLDILEKQRKHNFSLNMKGEDDIKKKINSFSDAKDLHTVLKVKAKDQILHVQRKITEFQGWHIDNDTNQLQ